MAHEYYLKPSSMGGGGNSFLNFLIPEGFSPNANGTYSIKVNGSATSIKFEGIGTSIVSGNNHVTVDMIVYAPNIGATDSMVVVYWTGVRLVKIIFVAFLIFIK